jgi:hypothetical protein
MNRLENHQPVRPKGRISGVGQVAVERQGSSRPHPLLLFASREDGNGMPGEKSQPDGRGWEEGGVPASTEAAEGNTDRLDAWSEDETRQHPGTPRTAVPRASSLPTPNNKGRRGKQFAAPSRKKSRDGPDWRTTDPQQVGNENDGLQKQTILDLAVALSEAQRGSSNVT